MSSNPPPPTNPNANADPDLEEGLDESQARGPEVVNEAELSVPTPSTILGISDTISKDGINLEAYEVKQALSEKIMAPAESVTDVAETLPDGEEVGVGAEDADDVISPLVRNDEATIASEAGTRFGDGSTLGVNSVGSRHSAGRGDDASTVHMPEAVLVNEEGGGAGGGAVIVATPVGPALPWHKQPRNRVLMGTVFLFVAGIITAVAVLSSGSNSDDTSGAATSVSSTENRPGLQPSTITDTTAAPTPVRDCFADREELQEAVDEYIDTDCGADQTACTTITQKYGWPMNAWCVGNVTSLQGLFNFKEEFNEDISDWDVSRVTDFSHMFNFSSSFNQNLSAWDTSSATNFSSMFANASAFDNDISTWDTSNVLDMQALFFGARSFKGDVSKWNTSNVRNMYGTFAGAASFDGELGDWDVSKVRFVFRGVDCFFFPLIVAILTKLRSTCFHFSPTQSYTFTNHLKVETMYGTFAMALQFTGGGIGSWDVSSCMDMFGMFYIAVAFDEDLSGWDVSKVWNMYGTFAAATSFRGIGLENWNVSSMTYCHGMFYDALVFNADVSKWDVSSVTDMSNMFNGARSFNHPLGAWNISGLEAVYGLVSRAESFNQDLCAWGDQFPYTEANNNFLDSGCAFKDDPTIEDKGPFCASDCQDEQ